MTGITTPQLLRASHIKKFRRCDSTNEQRDPSNGLSLSGTVDLLFENGYISFESEGTIMISDRLAPEYRKRLGIGSRLQIKGYAPDVDRYMEWHRQHCFCRVS